MRIEGNHNSKLTNGGGSVAQRVDLSCSVVKLPRATESLGQLGEGAFFVQAKSDSMNVPSLASKEMPETN